MNSQYGRKYRIMVVDGDRTALDVSDLRCTFEIEKSIKAWNYADISIYNLGPDLEQAIITAGMRVIVEAGYQDGLYGKIFDGDIIQPMWDRENVTDFRLTLRCIDGDTILNNNMVNVNYGPNFEYVRMISAMASQARKPIEFDHISPSVTTKSLPRGRTFFGEPKNFIRRFAQDNNADFHIQDGKAVISKITDQSPNSSDAYVISPETGMVGAPQQVQDGVTLRCLLNPMLRINPQAPMLVKLDNKFIRQQKVSLGEPPTSRLDADGLYKVAKVTHSGDTRGNEWYTDIVGVNSDAQGLLPMMFQVVIQHGD